MRTAIDTETFLFFPGYMAPELVCASYADKKGSGVLHGNDPILEQWFEDRLNGETIWANAPYDLAVIAAKFPRLIKVIFRALDEGRVHDVQTREKLLDLARGTFRFEEDEDGNVFVKGYSLFAIALRRLNRYLEKDTYRMRYHELWDVPLEEWPPGAIDYATDDAQATLDTYKKQRKLKKYLGDEAAQVRAHFALHLMTCRGFMTDPEKVDELEKRTRKEIKKIKGKLMDLGLVREDGSRDMKAAIRRIIRVTKKDVVLTEGGLSLLREGMSAKKVLRKARREGKYVSVSYDAAILSGDDVMIAFSQYGRLRNLITGSIKDFRAGSVLPIQSRFDLLKATGRTGSSGPNIQNLRRAKGVRECFVAREGFALLAHDYESAELHTLAQVCTTLFGFSRLADALNGAGDFSQYVGGVDVHVWVGAQLARIEYDDAILFTRKLESLSDDERQRIFDLTQARDELELRERFEETAETVASMRQLAKAANFGFPGGCSAKRFVAIAKSWGVEISIREAAKLKQLWLDTWPELALYFEYVGSCKFGQGFYFVKQVGVERIRSNCTYTAACNSLFQGLASDGAKAALYEVTKATFGFRGHGADLWYDPEHPLLGSACVNFVHDEIITETPLRKVHVAAQEKKRIMEEEMNRFTPDCPTSVEPTAMIHWSKKAKSKYIDGELVPWEMAA